MPSSNINSILLQPRTLVVTLPSPSSSSSSSSSVDDPNQDSKTNDMSDDEQQHEIECSVHTLPKQLLREFRHVFGEKYLLDTTTTAVVAGIPTGNENSQDGSTDDDDDDAMNVDPPDPTTSSEQQQQQQQQLQQLQSELIAIPTNQHARKDLVATGDDIELEKDRLLNVVRTLFLSSGVFFFSLLLGAFFVMSHQTQKALLFCYVPILCSLFFCCVVVYFSQCFGMCT